jgi:hypothetical protein
MYELERRHSKIVGNNLLLQHAFKGEISRQLLGRMCYSHHNRTQLKADHQVACQFARRTITIDATTQNDATQLRLTSSR